MNLHKTTVCTLIVFKFKFDPSDNLSFCCRLYNAALSKATYPEVEKIRKIMSESGVNAHSALAKELPLRVSFVDDHNTTTGTQPRDASDISAQQPEGAEALEEQIDQYVEERIAEQVSSVRIYPRLSAAHHGMCAVVTNFTTSLPGYVKDEKNIVSFFGELGYQVRSMRNVTRAQLFEFLESVREELIAEEPAFDRFVLFLLSHGDARGIHMCADAVGELTETCANGNIKRVTWQEVVAQFTHDKIETLRQHPKCFFFQHCQGSTSVRAAGKSQSKNCDSSIVSTPLPIGVDTAAFLSTFEGYQAFVDDVDGSWFIRETIKSMRTLHESEHLVDIMTSVNDALATKRDLYKGKTVFQLPTILSRLRGKFYLTK